MKQLLVIAYYFPPFGYGGVQRIFKFVKYLPLYGWKPTVLTISPHAFYAFDYSFLKEIPEQDIGIWRTDPGGVFSLMKGKKTVGHTKERLRRVVNGIGQFLYIPDNKIGWKKQALAFLEQKDLSPFSAVLSTAPPFTVSLVGLEVKRRYGLPLVSDFRDAWLDFPYRRYWTPWHRMRNAALERDVVLGSDAVVVTNRYMQRLLSERYGRGENIHVVSQGYDPDDFAQAERRPDVSVREDEVNFVYSGVFYEDRTPLFLYRALAALRERHPQVYGRLRFYMVGFVQEEYREAARQLRVDDRFVYCGYVEHPTAIAWLGAADVLWFNIGTREKGHETVSPGKFFEYLGSGKPILGIVPDNDIRTILQSMRHTFVLGPDDTDALVETLVTLAELKERGALPQAEATALEPFDRKALTGQLAQIMGRVGRNPEDR